jgi:ribonuclease HI
LKKAFEWSGECEEAFKQLKKYLSSTPLLSRTTPGEPLYLYLAVSPTAVSAALIREEANVQKPVYFISRALRGAEQRYMQMEKMAFALTIASRKLRPYFQAHTIKVLTEYPLKKVLRKLDLSGRLVNWAIELSEFDVEFVPRNAIKGQILADFVAKFTGITEEAFLKVDLWIIHVDGSATRQGGGAGVMIKAPNGESLLSSWRLEFWVTNNEAEYEAVIAGLRIAQEMGAEHVELRSDSQVIVGHIQGTFEAKGEKMKLYLSRVQDMQASLKRFSIIKIPRSQNEEADLLARMGSGTTKDSETRINVPI